MTRLLCLIIFASIVSVAVAQEPVPTQPDEKQPEPPKAAGIEIPSTFRAHVAWDKRSDEKNFRNRTRKLHDFVCENELNPSVAVFSRTIPKDKDAPLAKLIEALHLLANEQKLDGANFGAYVIFLALDMEFPLDDKRDDYRDEVLAFGKAVGSPPLPANSAADLEKKRPADYMSVPLALAAKVSKQVTEWKLGDDDINVVFYHRHKEVKRWSFAGDKPTAADIATIIATVKSHLDGK